MVALRGEGRRVCESGCLHRSHGRPVLHALPARAGLLSFRFRLIISNRYFRFESEYSHDVFTPVWIQLTLDRKSRKRLRDVRRMAGALQLPERLHVDRPCCRDGGEPTRSSGHADGARRAGELATATAHLLAGPRSHRLCPWPGPLRTGRKGLFCVCERLFKRS